MSEQAGRTPPPEMRSPATRQSDGTKTSLGNINHCKTATSPVDFQARKLRRLFSFCHAVACAIASLAYAGGPR